MARYIDADALKDELELADFETDYRMFGGQTVLFEDSVFKIVDSAPTISPDEVRGVGEWIEAAGGNYLVCPECKYDHALYDRLGYSCEHEYCPNCGKRLRMKGAETSE